MRNADNVSEKDSAGFVPIPRTVQYRMPESQLGTEPTPNGTAVTLPLGTAHIQRSFVQPVSATKQSTVPAANNSELPANQTLQSGALPERLEQESLTSLQLLHRSANCLMTAMHGTTSARDLVSIATALASTVQVQVNLVKALRSKPHA
jgi:hypothetical protein